MTTAAEFYGDPAVLDELAVLYSGITVSFLAPVVIGMLAGREEDSGRFLPDQERQHIFRDDVRTASIAVLHAMGDPARLNMRLDQIMREGTEIARKEYPAVDAFLRGEFDDFMRKVLADPSPSESG